MQSTDDSAWLREYAESNSEEAFAALVTKYINLVYSVAMRSVGNAASAEEITQVVFIILARKAGQLRNDKALSSWLFKTTQLTANNFLRSELRRQVREQEAHDMQTILNEPEPELWPRIAPLLDNAVAALNEKDRRAILLRFYEGKNLREIGNLLGTNEPAAEKRVSRALEKLRKFFTKRGVSSTTAIIAGTISANSVQAAPVALAKSVTAVAIAKCATASASTLTLIKGALKLMAWTKTQSTIVAGVAILLAAGTTAILVYHHPQLPAKAASAISKQSDFPKNSWRFAGYADPESAFESTFWAMNQRDAKSYLVSLAPDGSLFREAQGKSENEIIAQNKQLVDGIVGYKIIDVKMVSDDEVIITFQPEMPAGQKPVPSGRLVVRKNGDEWKIAG